jgi:hypothetical protein
MGEAYQSSPTAAAAASALGSTVSGASASRVAGMPATSGKGLPSASKVLVLPVRAAWVPGAKVVLGFQVLTTWPSRTSE